MAASLLCCCWWFHVSAGKGLWQISAVPGTGVELWSEPCLGAMEVKWQSIDWEDGRLKNLSASVLGQGHAPFLQPLWPTPTAEQDAHFTCIHIKKGPYKDPMHKHVQKLHYDELPGSNHPRLFPIITISFNNNHIKWQDEILHDDT